MSATIVPSVQSFPNAFDVHDVIDGLNLSTVRSVSNVIISHRVHESFMCLRRVASVSNVLSHLALLTCQTCMNNVSYAFNVPNVLNVSNVLSVPSSRMHLRIYRV